MQKIRLTESTTAIELRKPIIGNISVKESAIIKWLLRKREKEEDAASVKREKHG